MLIDEAEIVLTAGHGGAGKVSFNPGKKGGPNGGSGGKGGDVYLSVTADLKALNRFSKSKSLEAQNGEQGGSFNKTGRNGQDLDIQLPLGAEVTDLKTGEIFVLNNLDTKILICRSGLGGKGNFELKSSRRTTPEFAQKGLSGQQRKLKVELKFIADFGLIGLPNAGKSSLLNELTAANVKTAEYPFTTLEPNLGAWRGKIIADIPGLIEGAAEGKGLGIKFLKHIEKVKLLLHCIPADSENVLKDYWIVKKEMEKYSPGLIKKMEIVILTKSDLVEKSQIEQKMNQLKKLKVPVLTVSIHDFDSLQNLQEALNKTN